LKNAKQKQKTKIKKQKTKKKLRRRGDKNRGVICSVAQRFEEQFKIRPFFCILGVSNHLGNAISVSLGKVSSMDILIRK